MTRKLTLALSLVLASLSLASVASAQEVGHREVHQQRRIVRGVENGTVTNREARHLERGEARIEHAREVANADGVQTRGEHRRLNRMENRENRRIIVATHNGRVR